MSQPTVLRVRNASTHNLKGVDLEIPRDALVVFTGVSGSGKSSLAFDTIFLEGQRRFLESLSSYARQFLGQLERPAVDAVEGVSPSISIDQKTVNRNPRSTVGTLTEIADHWRLLFARLGLPHCPRCGKPVRRLALDQLVQRALEQFADQRVLVLGPLVRDRKGEHRREVERAREQGWARVRVNGQVYRVEEVPELARYEKHRIEVVVDRLVVRQTERGRLNEALERALGLGQGVVLIAPAEGGEELVLSTERACVDHPEQAIPELEPRFFSFNAPQGACVDCAGLGVKSAFDLSLILDPTQRVPEAFLAFNESGNLPFSRLDRDGLVKVARALGAPVDQVVARWPAEVVRPLLQGDPQVLWRVVVARSDGEEVRESGWPGLLGLMEMLWKYGLEFLEAYRSKRTCEACSGERLNPIARQVTFRGVRLPELSGMSVDQALAWVEDLHLEPREAHLAGRLVQEARSRLHFLAEVGVGYLSLDRGAATLSGGEAQRIRLAAQVGSALQGVTYVLDEPSIGLHARDNRRLLGALKALRDRGNSVLVVEHDAETMLAADWLVDVGPGAGRAGGEIVASGPPALVRAHPLSPTGAWLRGERVLPRRARRTPGGWLGVQGATCHNLQDLDVQIPLGVLCAVTGVSGSGKSSLVFGVLEPTVRRGLAGGGAVNCRGLSGLSAIKKLICLDQAPIGRTPRSNTATYTGLWDVLRDLFAALPEAKARGYRRGRFSFNVEGGRCEVCSGAGVQEIEMQFLPSVQVRCDTCRGRRFNEETLELRWRGRNVAEVLDLTCAEALELFGAVPRAARILRTLVEVGLGYLPIGQPSTTLSGGEAQRVKLASELQRPAKEPALYLLDEPTTGLHFSDVERLVAALHRLVDAGHTVLVVEHHTDVLEASDWLIDLGPEGGGGGGRLVGSGPPEQIRGLDTPTGQVLASLALGEAPALAAEAPLRRPSSTGGGTIVVTGARQHNLRDLHVQLPHGALTVISGPSGSGKTSLALDTIFAEGQRHYIESLSTYARRFLGRRERPLVERLEGLQPGVAIDQLAGAPNPRSTVATTTEIQDVLRLLYARVGLPHCPICDREVAARPPALAAAWLREQDPGVGWILAHLRPVPASEAPLRRQGLLQEGFARLWLEGREIDLQSEQADQALGEGAALVLDRFSPRRESAARVAEAVAAAQKVDLRPQFRAKSGGIYSLPLRPECPEHGVVHEGELTPRHFSFNTRLGACERCKGQGVVRGWDRDRALASPARPLPEALDERLASRLGRSPKVLATLRSLLGDKHRSTPWKSLPAALQEEVWSGRAEPLTVRWQAAEGGRRRSVTAEVVWTGLAAWIESLSLSAEDLPLSLTCPDCGGGRLRPALLAVKVQGRSIHQLERMTVSEALVEVRGWRFAGSAAVVAERPVQELERRLGFLEEVGLGYLPLDRGAATLSGGEARRIRLASQLGAQLTGVTYVLDEPTVGLHPQDIERLLGTLFGLRDQGNTLLVVEHDLEVIRRADHLIDLGPTGGVGGGQLMAAGTPAEVALVPTSPTGRWLAGVDRWPARAQVRAPRAWHVLRGARLHNNAIDEVRIPTGVLVVVSGVSGAGKSTLVLDTLLPALERLRDPSHPVPAGVVLEPGEAVDRVQVVDQSPIGRSPRSVPASALGLLDPLRALFASTPAAALRGYLPGRFSFNTEGGRCLACSGLGSTLVEMHFLPDVWVTCEVCGGRRFDAETLEIRWNGLNIADVLALPAAEAVEHFQAHPALRRGLQALIDVGLGYLPLGQPSTTLSGGEAQRVRLAAELGSRSGRAVYVLDEPTTGLHPSDVTRLLEVIHHLVDQGNTVISVEHDLDWINQADWVIDLGPGPGSAGGRVVAEGPPAVVRTCGSPTGRFLARRR